MKIRLTPMDEMRLDSSRGKGARKPTVEAYNRMVTGNNPELIGQPITPIGSKGTSALN